MVFKYTTKLYDCRIADHRRSPTTLAYMAFHAHWIHPKYISSTRTSTLTNRATQGAHPLHMHLLQHLCRHAWKQSLLIAWKQTLLIDRHANEKQYNLPFPDIWDAHVTISWSDVYKCFFSFVCRKVKRILWSSTWCREHSDDYNAPKSRSSACQVEIVTTIPFSWFRPFSVMW